MASSRASTPAGKRRPAPGTGRTPARKPSKPKAAKAKPKSKPAQPKAAKPKAAKSKAVKPKAAKPRTPKPKAARAGGTLRWPVVGASLGAFLIVLTGVYLAWFKDSSFVRVENVKVEGIEGPEAEAVTAALTESALGMSTLDFDQVGLETVASSFQTVAGLEVDTDFPHGMTITVTDRPPVIEATSGDRAVAVAGDGTILPSVDAGGEKIPSVDVDNLPEFGRLEGNPLAFAQVAGAAPAEMRPLIESLDMKDGDGLTVTLDGGIPVLFGDSSRAGDKWAAVVAVLADSKINTLTHLDVRVPQRPAIGGAATPPETPEEVEYPVVTP